MEKRYLTVKETSKLLDISENSIRVMVAPSSKTRLKINGQVLKPSRINRRLRFDRLEIERLMSSNN